MVSIDFRQSETEKKIKFYPQSYHRENETQFESTSEITDSNILVEI